MLLLCSPLNHEKQNLVYVQSTVYIVQICTVHYAGIQRWRLTLNEGSIYTYVVYSILRLKIKLVYYYSYNYVVVLQLYS